MKLTCPKCAEVDSMNFNMESDVACCAQCGELFVLSRLVKQTQWLLDLNNVAEPPPGVAFSKSPDGWKIEASTRNLAHCAAYALGVIVSVVFVVLLGRELLSEQKFKVDGALMMLAIAVAGAGCLVGCLASVFGRIEIEDRQGKGTVFIGVANVGITRRFMWSQLIDVREESTYYAYGSSVDRITLIGAEISFGRTVFPFRKEWIVRMLQKIVVKKRLEIAASGNSSRVPSANG